ncbi:MAG: hypothetical protein O7A63_03265 [Acidobacteria bacterium]|nr:hypothetical protein [Acidobacteriota bacterium]
MIQLASIVGAALILIAYAAHQSGRMGRDSLRYHIINAAGGGILLVVAIHAVQIGFILLEGVWTLISLAAIVRVSRGSNAKP